MADDAKQLDEKWVVVPLKKKTYSKDYTFWVRYSKNDMDEKRFTSLILQKNKEFKKILQKINMSLFDNRRRLIHRESYSPVDEERDLKLVGIEESKLNKKRDQKLREIRILGEIAPMPAVKQLVTTVEQKYNEYNEYKRERRILLGL